MARAGPLHETQRPRAASKSWTWLPPQCRGCSGMGMPRARSLPAARAQPACELCSVAVRVPQCMTSVLALVCLRMMCSTTACTRMIFYAEAVGFFGLPTIMLCPCPHAFPSCHPAPPLLSHSLQPPSACACPALSNTPGSAS